MIDSSLKSRTKNRPSEQDDSFSSVPLSRDLFRKVRYLEIHTRLRVRDLFGGRYHSVFKGQGMDFAEVREYQPGDDIRLIDWNVSARMGHLYVKLFQEERELTIMLLVDISGSTEFGTRTALKRELAAELTALLSLCALLNNDKVGLLLFSDRVEKFVAPKKGHRHTLRLIREVLAYQAQSKGTDLNTALQYALHALRKRAVIFIISDFESPDDYFKTVKVASRKHDIIAIELFDPREREIIPVGWLPLYSPEEEKIVWVDTRRKGLIEGYHQRTQQSREKRHSFFRSIRIDHIELSTAESYINPLIRFFRNREMRSR